MFLFEKINVTSLKNENLQNQQKITFIFYKAKFTSCVNYCLRLS